MKILHYLAHYFCMNDAEYVSYEYKKYPGEIFQGFKCKKCGKID